MESGTLRWPGAQGVTKLMNCHRKQVRPSPSRRRGECAGAGPHPTLAPPGSPGERGLLVDANSQGERSEVAVAVATSAQTPSPGIFSLLCGSTFGRSSPVAWFGSATHPGGWKQCGRGSKVRQLDPKGCS